MRTISTLLLALSLILVISCAALKQEEIDPWLNTISGSKQPEIDVTGRWHDTQGDTFFAWGEGFLRQEGNMVSGIIGNYTVKGIVSGKTVYLVFTYRKDIHYTARLESFQDLLTGDYFGARDKEQKKGYPASFAKDR
jgi:hypothetical protein